MDADYPDWVDQVWPSLSVTTASRSRLSSDGLLGGFVAKGY